MNGGIMLNEPFKSFSAVFPIIKKKKKTGIQILLHRRQNTGYQDGKWDIAGSGHVNKNETAQAALIRECKEEIGIDVKLEDIDFVHLSHRLSKDRIYYDIYFVIKFYLGTPTIMEADKCSEMEWFFINNLPIDIIDCRKQDILNYLGKIYYSEKIES
jgi:8-oxo-dGTP pyrophosphatase MutT (NUDIX family)